MQFANLNHSARMKIRLLVRRLLCLLEIAILFTGAAPGGAATDHAL